MESDSGRRIHPPGFHRGEDNPAFKGDAASYNALHYYVRRRFAKRGVCSECGAEGKTDMAFMRWPEPHTRNVDDYRELCRRCHQKHDVATGERNYDHLRK